MKKLLLTILFFAMTLIVNAQVEKILGEWRTVDDRTGETKGIVEFYQDSISGLYYGRTTHVYDKGVELFEPQYIGLILFKDFKEDDGMLKGGTIWEPHENKTYHGRLSYNAKDNTLIIRGSIDRFGWLGRTQIWVK